MSYAGYRVKIGNTIIKETMIAPDSYDTYPFDRIEGTWEDGDDVKHREITGEGKVIVFSIRERNAADHASIAGIFEYREHISVQVYNDITGNYDTLDCWMEAPHIKTSRNGSTLWYRETQIKLTEY